MQLRAADCDAVLDPADGGRLTSFRVHGHELLVQNGVDIFHWGSFVVAPWVGRLRDARLQHAGKEYRFPPNKGRHALHGLATERPWSIVGPGQMAIELGQPWPWPCRIVQTTTLSAGSAEFKIEVEAHEPMPAAVGWHPWFTRKLNGGPPEAALELDVRPTRMWANDPTGLPSGELVDPSPKPWDYCFRDLTADPVVRWPGMLELTVSSDCEDWVIFDMDDAGVCIEPWTAPPNSINMPRPRIVQPEQPLSTTMTWHWR